MPTGASHGDIDWRVERDAGLRLAQMPNNIFDPGAAMPDSPAAPGPAVAQPEKPAPAPANVDSHLRQGCPMPIDALVGVTNEEHVIQSLGHGRPK